MSMKIKKKKMHLLREEVIFEEAVVMGILGFKFCERGGSRNLGRDEVLESSELDGRRFWREVEVAILKRVWDNGTFDGVDCDEGV